MRETGVQSQNGTQIFSVHQNITVHKIINAFGEIVEHNPMGTTINTITIKNYYSFR